MSWTAVLPGVLRWADSCNVYALAGRDGVVIVDAGTGEWLDHLDALPAPVVAVLSTHFFRDHSAGCAEAARRGLAVYAPEHEAGVLADPALHFQRRESYIVYENAWEHFAPIEATRLAGVLGDYETVVLAGLEIEVVPLPGACIGQTGFAVALPGDGRRVVLCGEAVHATGRVARLAPLQWAYADATGVLAAYGSALELRRRAPDALLPSLGEPILDDVAGALDGVMGVMRDIAEARRREAHGDRPEAETLELWDSPSVVWVGDRVLQSERANAISTFIVGDTGRLLAIDYGYNFLRGTASYAVTATPRSRRALLHSLDGLRDAVGTDRIDVVLASHYHDDHVAGIALLQRLQGTACWAAETFAALLERPERYAFPCTWPQPIEVSRRLGAPSTVEWDGITLHVSAPISGHTRFSTLIGFEVGGVRYAHTGDQYFFQEYFISRTHRPWAEDRMAHSHVYRNGAALDGYRRSAEWLLGWRPDVVLSGHQAPMVTDDAFFAAIEDRTRDYEDEHRAAMVLGDSEEHFGLDSWGGWIEPYRMHLPVPGVLRATVTVRNPKPARATLGVRLVGPGGRRGARATIEAAPREDVTCALELEMPVACRRAPYAVDMTVDGRPCGQVAEALVTVGGERF